MDTGVLVAGIFWRHEPHLCVTAWLRGMFTLVLSDAIFVEYERVLREVKAERDFTTDLEPWQPCENMATGSPRRPWPAPSAATPKTTS